MEAYREKRKVKRCIIQSKKKVNKQFWKEVSNVKGGKVESYSIIKDGNRKLGPGGGQR